eukprot:143193_1
MFEHHTMNLITKDVEIIIILYQKHSYGHTNILYILIHTNIIIYGITYLTAESNKLSLFRTYNLEVLTYSYATQMLISLKVLYELSILEFLIHLVLGKGIQSNHEPNMLFFRFTNQTNRELNI